MPLIIIIVLVICTITLINSFSLKLIHNCGLSQGIKHEYIHKSLQKDVQMKSLDTLDIYVMVNGMPGPMATVTAEACLRRGLKITPVAMTGPEITPSTITVADAITGKSSNVRLIPSSNIEKLESEINGLRSILNDRENDKIFAIDYTHPSAINVNANFYASNSIPFVMGTTGGNRAKLIKDVEDSGLFSVIAPNMAKQIVAMQAGLEYLANKFPSAFGGYKLAIKESHQKNKVDTSGTALDLMDSLIKLSNDSFHIEDIEKIRNDHDSMLFGVPEEHLKGHAFHTYSLTSKDETVKFQLSHNIEGRKVYAEGTVDAVMFLYEKIKKGGKGRIYSMIDILEEGLLDN